MLNHEVPFHGYLPSQIPSTCDVVDANHGWKVQIRGSTVDLDGDWRPQNLLACLQKPANGKKKFDVVLQFTGCWLLAGLPGMQTDPNRPTPIPCLSTGKVLRYLQHLVLRQSSACACRQVKVACCFPS
uniref:Uncharacterized protein n=1 Tax=Eutreptiella gymnastica TaxID=73025 RepID=A0A7S1HS60_9EUGL|mmetsp:Transcript_101354/g.175035  ORF Transcript_101354/g.175035 Transcript_101354/m.175035 type:complete len:128 (+) Transcript_101354:501-884(+)